MNRVTRRTKVQRGGMPGAVPVLEMDTETGEIFLPMGQHPEGLILYTPDRCMSAELSSPEPHNFASGNMYHGTPEEYVVAGRGPAISPTPAPITATRPAGPLITRCT